jgi:spore coat polysaccharide biosynthesis predicted glycosyltransferase SpsG
MIAEYHVSRFRILIRVDAGLNLGMGHAYRALALAQELAQHRISIVISQNHPLSSEFFAQHPFDVLTVSSDEDFISLVNLEHPDLVILDQLDTSREYVAAIKNAADSVVTFEDLGEGANEANLLVSDLYKNPNVPDDQQLNGLRNSILSPAFNSSVEPIKFNQEVKNILVVFGGTDPSGLANKSLKALGAMKFAGNVIVVRGLGASEISPLESYGLKGEILHNVEHMPTIMARVDLAISSAGRTITELLTLGIPVVCLCQNNKEITHTHASAEYGVINLGLGQLCDTATISAHLEHLMTNTELRQTLHERALRETSGRSNRAVIQRILNTVKIRT